MLLCTTKFNFSDAELSVNIIVMLADHAVISPWGELDESKFKCDLPSYPHHPDSIFCNNTKQARQHRFKNNLRMRLWRQHCFVQPTEHDLAHTWLFRPSEQRDINVLTYLLTLVCNKMHAFLTCFVARLIFPGTFISLLLVLLFILRLSLFFLFRTQPAAATQTDVNIISTHKFSI